MPDDSYRAPHAANAVIKLITVTEMHCEASIPQRRPFRRGSERIQRQLDHKNNHLVPNHPPVFILLLLPD